MSEYQFLSLEELKIRFQRAASEAGRCKARVVTDAVIGLSWEELRNVLVLSCCW